MSAQVTTVGVFCLCNLNVLDYGEMCKKSVTSVHFSKKLTLARWTADCDNQRHG